VIKRHPLPPDPSATRDEGRGTRTEDCGAVRGGEGEGDAGTGASRHFAGRGRASRQRIVAPPPFNRAVLPLSPSPPSPCPAPLASRMEPRTLRESDENPPPPSRVYRRLLP
jgi:hypothetical protein